MSDKKETEIKKDKEIQKDKEIKKDEESIIVDAWDQGQCCFCGCPCNPCSQSCGQCARDIWN